MTIHILYSGLNLKKTNFNNFPKLMMGHNFII